MDLDTGTRITIYVPKKRKEYLEKLASMARPQTSTTKLAAYLIELGLKEYEESLKENTN